MLLSSCSTATPPNRPPIEVGEIDRTGEYVWRVQAKFASPSSATQRGIVLGVTVDEKKECIPLEGFCFNGLDLVSGEHILALNYGCIDLPPDRLVKEVFVRVIVSDNRLAIWFNQEGKGLGLAYDIQLRSIDPTVQGLNLPLKLVADTDFATCEVMWEKLIVRCSLEASGADFRQPTSLLLLGADGEQQSVNFDRDAYPDPGNAEHGEGYWGLDFVHDESPFPQTESVLSINGFERKGSDEATLTGRVGRGSVFRMGCRFKGSGRSMLGVDGAGSIFSYSDCRVLWEADDEDGGIALRFFVEQNCFLLNRMFTQGRGPWKLFFRGTSISYRRLSTTFDPVKSNVLSNNNVRPVVVPAPTAATPESIWGLSSKHISKMIFQEYRDGNAFVLRSDGAPCQNGEFYNAVFLGNAPPGSAARDDGPLISGAMPIGSDQVWRFLVKYDNRKAAKRGVVVGASTRKAAEVDADFRGFLLDGIDLSDGCSRVAAVNYGSPFDKQDPLPTTEEILMRVCIHESLLLIWFARDGTPLGLAFKVPVDPEKFPLYPAVRFPAGCCQVALSVWGRSGGVQTSTFAIHRTPISSRSAHLLSGCWIAEPPTASTTAEETHGIMSRLWIAENSEGPSETLRMVARKGESKTLVRCHFVFEERDKVTFDAKSIQSVDHGGDNGLEPLANFFHNLKSISVCNQSTPSTTSAARSITLTSRLDGTAIRLLETTEPFQPVRQNFLSGLKHKPPQLVIGAPFGRSAADRMKGSVAPPSISGGSLFGEVRKTVKVADHSLAWLTDGSTELSILGKRSLRSSESRTSSEQSRQQHHNAIFIGQGTGAMIEGRHVWRLKVRFGSLEDARASILVGVTHPDFLLPSERLRGLFFNGYGLYTGCFGTAAKNGTADENGAKLLADIYSRQELTVLMVVDIKQDNRVNVSYVWHGKKVGRIYSVDICVANDGISEVPFPLYPAVGIRGEAEIEIMEGPVGPEAGIEGDENLEQTTKPGKRVATGNPFTRWTRNTADGHRA